MFRRITRLQAIVDAAVALAVVGPLVVFDLVVIGQGQTSPLLAVWPLALGALLAALLALRRMAPVPVLLTALLLSAVHVLVLQQEIYAVWFSVLVLLATIGRYGERARDFWITGCVILAAAALVSIAAVRILLGFGSGTEAPVPLEQLLGTTVFGFVPAALLFAGAVLAGVVLRLIVRSNREAKERRAAERSMIVQMHLREAEAERTAIARDMHDVVAHSLAVVVAQANGARYTADVERKDATFATIAETARTALGDVRGLLHQLRHSQASDASMEISDIPGLVDRMRAARLDVRLVMPEAGIRAASATQVAAYRIVQEAMTNAMRHGQPDAPVFVRIALDAGSVLIDVHNRPRVYGGAERADDGHGIRGIRERAALTGGMAWVGFDSGWFRVHARLPLEVQA